MGIAGFSAILVGLSRPTGGFDPPERFRLTVLIYSSMGAMFFALLPFAIFGGGWSDSTNWTLLGTLITLYVGAGIIFLPIGSLRLRADYPELFPLYMVLIQLSIHTGAFVLSLMIMLGLTKHQVNVYTMALILLLVHGAIAFVRTLFHRKD